MYSPETVESLHAYAGRLTREVARARTSTSAPRPAVRGLLRKVRRSA